jgi:hypothetical protein
MKWKIIPIVIASFILVQCRSNKAVVQETLKALSAEVKNVKSVARTGSKSERAKLPEEIARIEEAIQSKKENSAYHQVSEELASLQRQVDEAKQLAASSETRINESSPETRINELSENIIQESHDVFTSDDESKLRDFLKGALCMQLDARTQNRSLTDADYEELAAKSFLPPNKQNELRDKIDRIRELGKSISEGNPDGAAAIQAYCVIS